jgi:hypothetical protein
MLGVPPADLKPATLQLRSANVCCVSLGLFSVGFDRSEAVMALQSPLTGITQVEKTLLARVI